jgi:hypothetical protein
MEPQTPENQSKRRRFECLSPEKSPKPVRMPTPIGTPRSYGAYACENTSAHHGAQTTTPPVHKSQGMQKPHRSEVDNSDNDVSHSIASPATTKPDQDAHQDGLGSRSSSTVTKIRVGMIVKRRSSDGRARRDRRTYTATARINDDEWEIEDDMTKERTVVQEKNLAIARKIKTDGTEDAKEDGHSVDGWHKLACTRNPAAVWYRLGGSEVKCITFTPEFSLSPGLCHKHVVTDHLLESSDCTAGGQLKRAIETIQSHTQAATSFKVGMTSNPFQRWEFYDQERQGWSRLVLLAAFEVAETAAERESSLIHVFKDDEKCRNQAPGGEGLEQMKKSGQPYFVYVVVSFQ